MGAGVLPVAIHQGVLYFLFGEEADEHKWIDFGGGAKAWRDIWGAGQGVGQNFDAPPAAELVARLKAEYEAARAALFAGETVPTQLKQAAE